MNLLVPTAIVAGAAGLLKVAERVGHRDFVSSTSLLTRMLAPSSEAKRDVGRALAA